MTTSWPVAVIGLGDGGADPAAADDDDLHDGSSGIGSRTTQTAHGAFCRTYGMVRPMAKSPPNRLRYGRPTTSRSAPALDRLVDDRGADVARLEQDRLEPDPVLLGDGLGACRGRAGPPRSGRRCRRRAAASSRSRRRGRRRARPSSWRACVRDEADDPAVARAAVQGDDGAPERRRVGSDMAGHDTTGAGRRSARSAPARLAARAGVAGGSLAGRARRRARPRTWPAPRAGTGRRRRPCAAGRAGPSGGAWPPGCRGSAPTSCGRRTRG